MDLKRLMNWLVGVLGALAILTFTACSEQSDTEEALDEAQDATEEAAEESAEAMKKAAEEAGHALEEAGDEVEDATK